MTAPSSGTATLMSATLPGVSAKATGRPRSSAKQWIRGATPARAPDRLRPLPPFAPAAERCAFLRTVEAEFVRNIARSGNLLEQALPKPALRPSIVAIVDRGRRTVFGRHVAPTASVLRTCKMPLMTRRSSTRGLPGSARKYDDRGPRFIGQPKKVRHHNLPIRRTQSEGKSPNKAIDCMGSLPSIRTFISTAS